MDGTFERPVHVASPPQDPRLFVVEQGGLVRIVDADGGVRAEPFLDLRTDTLRDHNERGLLSIAFPPDYTESGRFYVYLTAVDPEGELQVREYRRSATDAYRADAASGRIVLRQAHAQNGNHNGGSMAFGPDGRLWIGTGDGGGANDPLRSGQDLTTLLGKLLRIDPLGPPPADNPFAGATDGRRPEIWAYGLRNPWRFSFDRQTGDLVIGDVGQNAREEVDFAPASAGRGGGANYGWVCFEGSAANPAAPAGCQAPGHVAPVHERLHSSGDCSITGGHVVRDPGLPTLQGRYLYGDVCQARLRSVVLAPGGASGDREETTLPVAQVSSFGEDACGRILATSLGSGRVLRIVDGQPSACAATVPPLPATPPPASGPGGEPGPAPCGPRIPIGGARRARTVLRSGLRVPVRVHPSCSFRVRGYLARPGYRLRSRTGGPGAGASTVRLRLGTAAARAVRRGRRGTLRLQVTATGPAGTFVGSASVRLR